MRRRPHVLVFVAGAAAALLLSAPALGAAWLSAELPVLTGSEIQQSAAIAVDPAAPGRAAVVGDDGTGAPPPRTLRAMTTDWSAGWSPVGALPHAPGSTSAGQADIAWGADDATTQNVYAVEAGGNAAGMPCFSSAGVYFSASSDGGATYDTALPVDVASTTTELIEPAIAVDRVRNRIYVAYSELKWPTSGCMGAPDASTILLLYSADGGTSWSPTTRVAPLATTGHYRSPALAVLPDGRVIVAFRNDSGVTPQIETETCSFYPSPPATNYCGAPTAGLVGASTVVGDATAPALVSGLAGAPAPSVVATDRRVTVAWHAGSGTVARAFAAMSSDGGVTFGPPGPIDSLNAGNQVAPRLAATADGRVDVAYLWDVSGGGIVSATSVSAASPLGSATSEAWSNPVVVQSAGAAAATGIAGQSAPLGRRLGVATAAVPTSLSPLPATVIAFTDTQTSGNQDVHVVGLLHGTTAPVIGAQTVTAHKNISTSVTVHATDDDGDPLSWSVGAQPSNPDSGVAVTDAARGSFDYKAANSVGPETFEAVASDGLHATHATINVTVVNDPPKISCSSLPTPQNTTLVIPVEACTSDPNGDPLTFDLDSAVGGSLERASGTWRFTPTHNRTESGSFLLHVSDGDKTLVAPVIVTITRTSGKVDLRVKDPKRRRVIARGMALRLAATALDIESGTSPYIVWNFGDGTPEVQGPAVAHRFRKIGSYTVKATSGTATVPIRVLVRRRGVELMAPPSIAAGVLEVNVRTRVAGKLLFRVDSRSHTISVPAGSSRHTLRIQVTSGPLARLVLRLTPKQKATLPALTLRQLVLVSPHSAG